MPIVCAGPTSAAAHPPSVFVILAEDFGLGSPTPDSAPSSWHLAVNGPLGQLWSVVLPVLVCLRFGLDTRLTLTATVGW